MISVWKKLVLFAVVFGVFGGFAAFGGAAFGGAAFAYESPGSPSGYVNDFAGVLDPSVKSSLEASLDAFKQNTSDEVSVVIVKSLGGDYIENYAEKLFADWGIGDAKLDNGVLLLVAMEEREVRIEVGYGLEGALTDLESGRIVDGLIVPAFKDGDIAGGVTDGVNAIIGEIKGEYSVMGDASTGSATNDEMEGFFAEIGGFLFVIFLNVLFNIRRVFHGIGASRDIWPGAVFGGFLATLFSLILGATWMNFLIWFGVLGGSGLLIDWVLSRAKFLDNWRSHAKAKHDKGDGWWFIGGGGSGGGGFGGGGFGGFGGGSSGGGGASGRW